MEPRRCPHCGLPSYGEGVCSNCMSPMTGREPTVQRAQVSPVISSGSRFVSIMAGILNLGLGAFWLGSFALLLKDALDSRPEVVGGVKVYILAGFSLVLGLYTCFVSVLLFRRSYRARGELIMVSVAGIVLAIVAFWLLDTWYEVAVVGASGLLVLFALFGRRFFDFGE